MLHFIASSPLTLAFTCVLQRFNETMRGIQGALIVASCFQMVMGFVGLWRNTVRLVMFNMFVSKPV